MLSVRLKMDICCACNRYDGSYSRLSMDVFDVIKFCFSIWYMIFSKDVLI